MIRILIDTAILSLVKVLRVLLALLPISGRIWVIYSLLRIVFLVVRRPMRVARRNLVQAFPDRSVEEREQIARESLITFARLLVDALRLGELDADWVRTHVQHEVVPEYARIKAEAGGKGVLIATGHLSSFELLAHSAPFFGYPMAFVARRLPLSKLNRWFCQAREQRGNKVIDREGAVKTVLQLIENGTDVGILFDHNVTKNHAVFVKFLGQEAATTKLIGVSALRTQCPVCVACIEYLGSEQYRIKLARCEVDDIRQNQTASTDEKILAITERVSTIFETYVLEAPGQWFWIHDRWKTRPHHQIA